MINAIAYASLSAQQAFVVECVQRNASVHAILERAATLDLPGWYLGAGCIAQSVWNRLWGQPAEAHLKDIDLVYFIPDEGEDFALGNRVEAALEGLTALPLDVKNQAFVHLWYKKLFGFNIEPFTSTEHAITTWPTTSSTIALRLEITSDGERRYEMCAPYGLHDVLAGIVRPNKVQITQDVYERKVARWRTCWPELEIVCW